MSAMYLPPSSIHFTNCTGQADLRDLTKDTDIDILTSKFEEKGTLPKIQVVEKDGHYFSLNNIQLQVFRKLEEKGHCQNVKVELIAMKRVPVAIRDMMTLPSDDRGEFSTETHRVKIGRNRSCNDDNSDDDDDNDEDGNSLESYSLESSSESDTSEEEDEDESRESSTDASTEEELEEERESLL